MVFVSNESMDLLKNKFETVMLKQKLSAVSISVTS